MAQVHPDQGSKPHHHHKQASLIPSEQAFVPAPGRENVLLAGPGPPSEFTSASTFAAPKDALMVLKDYERAVVFRMGKVEGGPKGPGMVFVHPCLDTARRIDLRGVTYDIPPQVILTADSVSVQVDAVVFYRVSNPIMAVNNIENYANSTGLLAQTTLRNVLGQKTLNEILSDRVSIAHMIQETLDEATDPWGVKVERVEIKDAQLPPELHRAMAVEAEAAREARAKLITAEGELKASKALKEAADVIGHSPSALQLRYLQTLNDIASERNSTIIFPLPIEFLSAFGRK